ncbi:hypothetical protein K439DRAFT_1619211 [Ramaria rubella]|nr:hypothetical protein K439DRAFT_1619211 [Ramaria rubella]
MEYWLWSVRRVPETPLIMTSPNAAAYTSTTLSSGTQSGPKSMISIFKIEPATSWLCLACMQFTPHYITSTSTNKCTDTNTNFLNQPCMSQQKTHMMSHSIYSSAQTMTLDTKILQDQLKKHTLYTSLYQQIKVNSDNPDSSDSEAYGVMIHASKDARTIYNTFEDTMQRYCNSQTSPTARKPINDDVNSKCAPKSNSCLHLSPKPSQEQEITHRNPAKDGSSTTAHDTHPIPPSSSSHTNSNATQKMPVFSAKYVKKRTIVTM